MDGRCHITEKTYIAFLCICMCMHGTHHRSGRPLWHVIHHTAYIHMDIQQQRSGAKVSLSMYVRMYVCSIGTVDSHMPYAIRIHTRLHRSNSIIMYIHSTNPNDSTHLYLYKTLWKPCNTYVCTCSNWIEKTRHCFPLTHN